MTQFNIFYEGNLKTRCIHGDSGTEIRTDAPKDNRGEGILFSPTDLLAASLGSCILTVMAIAAQRLGVDLQGANVVVVKEMSKREPRRIGRIVVAFSCPQSFSSEIAAKLELAGRSCPVHHSLHPDLVQELIFRWGI